jgi:hypothetical protein
MTWKIINISNPGTSIKFGSDDMDKLSNLLSGTDVDDITINSDWVFRNGKFALRDSNNSHSYIFSTGDISSNITINIPALTSTSTLSFLEVAQNYTALQTIQKDAMPNFALYRNATLANGSRVGFHLDINSSTGTRRTFGKIYAEQESGTNAAEYGAIAANALINGSDQNILYVNGTTLFFGATNEGCFSLSGQTGSHTWTLPDINTALVGKKHNDYIDLKEIAEPGSPDSGYVRLFIDEDDGLTKVKRSNGDVVIVE